MQSKEEKRERNRERYHERYLYRKKNHLCTKCGEKLPDNFPFVSCDACRRRSADQKRRAKKIQYHERKKEHRCVICNKIISKEITSVYCDDCRKSELDRRKRNYQKKKKEGRCVSCGKPSLKGQALCDNCLEHRKEWRKQRAKPICDEDCFNCKYDDCIIEIEDNQNKKKEKGYSSQKRIYSKIK